MNYHFFVVKLCIKLDPQCLVDFKMSRYWLCFRPRSNLMGTKFTVYDNGTNPGKNPGTLLEESNTRQEVAAVCYVSRKKDFPRRNMDVPLRRSLYRRRLTCWASKGRAR